MRYLGLWFSLILLFPCLGWLNGVVRRSWVMLAGLM